MNELINLIQLEFFRNSLIAVVLTSIIAAIAGTYIVARKMVFISGGITHSTFGGIGLAYFLGWNPLLGATLFAILSALGIEWSNQKGNIREDSAIAILWSLGMAVGIIFVFLTPGYSPNLMSYLFGSILTVTTFDLVMMALLALVISILFYLFYRPILYTAFDSTHATAAGLPVKTIRYLLIIVVAITIVVSIRVVGVILVLSLFTIPQATANIFTKDFKRIIFYSMIFGLTGGIIGLFISYYTNIPSGASIIFALTTQWILTKIGSNFFTSNQ